MSLRKHDRTIKGRADKNRIELDDGDNNKKDKIEVIWNNAVYAKESAKGHLPGLYYMLFENGYPRGENT